MTDTSTDLEHRRESRSSAVSFSASTRLILGRLCPNASGAKRHSNLLVGASTVLGVSPGPRRYRIDLESLRASSVEHALADDWRRVGLDLASAVECERRER